MTGIRSTFATLALIAAAIPANAGEVPDLTGVWVMVETSGVRQGELGHSEATETPSFDERGGVWTTTISEQNDRSFVGTRASENHTEALIGTIGYDDQNIYMVDEDSHLYGRLLDDGRMEICILETGSGSMIAVCSLNERQP
jgi:hypothetical protein